MALTKKWVIAIVALIVVGLLALNGLYWWRCEEAKLLNASLVDGTCELTSSEYEAGWKQGWSVPVMGPKWTEVPCTVSLDIWAEDGKTVVKPVQEPLRLTFTYWQGVIWNVVTNRCAELVPAKRKGGRFECSYATDYDGRATVAFEGHVKDLPPKPLLLAMKAAGLSLMTLGPLVCLIFLWLRAAGRRQREAEEAESYVPMAAN
eukprot:TRINITY_DN28213_c0_g1_i2.p1 TRINITY_DN28213_c0_g1~~TRINITY_DN28213_c0_g1_i2.p1  ORF type:complete len:225 (-),score=23.27 TRINITY_DN28213_c0_g1_i2:128-739(-)